MNIEIIGRIRPSVSQDRASGITESQTIEVEGHNRLKSKLIGTTFTFQHLYKPSESTFDVFKSSIEPMIQLFMTGFNCCLLVLGDHASGKSYTISGQSSGQPGILPLLIQQLFTKFEDDNDMMMPKGYFASTRLLHLQMFEVIDDSSVLDLLSAPSSASLKLEVTDSAESGPCIANLSSFKISDNSNSQLILKQGWAKRTKKGTTFVYLDLSMPMQDTSPPTRSRFTIAVLPAIQPAYSVPSGIRINQPLSSEKSMVALSQLVATLANQPFPDRVINYSVCALTRLLENGLGGNCKSTALFCFRPSSNPTTDISLFQLADDLSKVKNYPIINNTFAQQLLTQYRAHIISLERQLNTKTHTINTDNNADMLKELQAENVVLQDSNERLQQKLEHLKTSFGSLAVSKTDLSAQLLLTEEEKLKISQTLLDMQIENNRLKEEMEATKFELNNKIIQLEYSNSDLGREKEKVLHIAQDAQEQLEAVKAEHKELADVYIQLKSEYMTLANAHQQEMNKNDELSLELLNIVNSKIALMEDMNTGQPNSLVSDRLRTIAGHLSKKPEDVFPLTNDPDSFKKNDQRNRMELERMKMQYEETEMELRMKIKELAQELMTSRKLTRETQKKLSQVNAQLITLKDGRSHYESQVNRLQHKLKDLNEEFQLRLVTYLKDVAESVKHRDGKSETSDLKYQIDVMLRDLKMAHKMREEQLSGAAQDFKRQLDQTIRRHEELLVAYRELRWQVEAKGLQDIELGPDEHSISMSDSELKSRQQQEIDQLQQKLAQLNKERLYSADSASDLSETGLSVRGSSWPELQKQLREFTLNTQQELEQERAELLSKNAMLQQEVEELHDYINTHLSRYRDEIIRLRQEIGDRRNVSQTKGQLTPRRTAVAQPKRPTHRS